MSAEPAQDGSPQAATVRVRNLRFRWRNGPPVLDIDAFDVAAGERVFLQGPSGSGKSTLLGVIAGVLTPQSGETMVLGVDLTALSGAKRDAFRAQRLGVVFQMFNLLPYLSVLGNVILPCRFSARRRAAALTDGAADLEEEARRLLGRLGLKADAILQKRTAELSVGQQQRVAAARALIGAPELIIADEPTSSLDADARDNFLTLLGEECARTGAALLFVSHDASLAARFDRAVDLSAVNRAAAHEAEAEARA